MKAKELSEKEGISIAAAKMRLSRERKRGAKAVSDIDYSYMSRAASSVPDIPTFSVDFQNLVSRIESLEESVKALRFEIFMRSVNNQKEGRDGTSDE